MAKNRRNPFGDSSKNFVFFPSLSHKKGVHRIVRGLESDCGLILLTGEIGIGKTSLARHIQNILADRFVFVELGNPYQTPLEQVFHCCEQFGLPTAGLSSIHDCVRELEGHFRTVQAGGQRPVIVFDESHLLTKRHLSLIHILSNLRLQDRPLVQLLIVGQLEILDLLATEGMEALNQRIGVRCELAPLVLGDTDKYIHFKLEKSGRGDMATFSKGAVKLIWRQSRGLPRLINHICAHAIDGLAFADTKSVSPRMVDAVCRDSVYSGLFQIDKKRKPVGRWLLWGGAGTSLAAALFLAGLWVAGSGVMDAGSAGEVRGTVVAMQEAPAPVAEPETPASETSVVEPATESVAVDVEPNEPEPFAVPKDLVVIVEEPEASGGVRVPASVPGLEEGFEPEDGSLHPVIGELVIGAIAWNEDPAQSIAVVNSKLLHPGEVIDNILVRDIGQDYVVFEYENKLFQRVISR